MAQAGYTPISLYYSTTASAVPTAGNLVNGELAINITDGKLYYKNNSGVVTLFGSSGDVSTISFGTTGLTPSVATGGAITVAGTLVAANGGTGQSSYTAGDLLYATGTTTLSKLGIGTNGQALLVSGGTLAWGTASATTINALTIAKTGGAAAPVTFNGSVARTIDYSTVGADQEGTAVAMAIALG
jgi:hypothetical protein